MNKKEIRTRQRARQMAVQALYQWNMTNQDIGEIQAQFITMNAMDKVDGEYFSELIRGVLEHREEIDAAFLPFLDRSIDSLQPVELTILRLGGYELMYVLQIPYKVVLDESVNLAKTFGAQDGYRYVNAVLNQLAKTKRAMEI